MAQELRFGLDLGRLALLKKKIWAHYEQLLRPAFSCSHYREVPLWGVFNIFFKLHFMQLFSADATRFLIFRFFLTTRT